MHDDFYPNEVAISREEYLSMLRCVHLVAEVETESAPARARLEAVAGDLAQALETLVADLTPLTNLLAWWSLQES